MEGVKYFSDNIDFLLVPDFDVAREPIFTDKWN